MQCSRILNIETNTWMHRRETKEEKEHEYLSRYGQRLWAARPSVRIISIQALLRAEDYVLMLIFTNRSAGTNQKLLFAANARKKERQRERAIGLCYEWTIVTKRTAVAISRLVHAISQTLATTNTNKKKEKRAKKRRFMSVDSTNLCPLLQRKRESQKDSVDWPFWLRWIYCYSQCMSVYDGTVRRADAGRRDGEDQKKRRCWLREWEARRKEREREKKEKNGRK